MKENISNYESLKFISLNEEAESNYINEEAENINDIIFDLENPKEIRLLLIESQDIDILVEIIKKLTGMYEFSGTNSLQSFLICLVTESKLSSIIKAECCKSLFAFEEYLEDINTDDPIYEIKKGSNDSIILRNEKRIDKAYHTLLYLCENFDVSISTTYKISLVILLLKETKEIEFYQQTFDILSKILSDINIDINFRYKTILSLNNYNDVKFKDKYKFNLLDMFSMNGENSISIRVLSIQNILQNFELDNTDKYENLLISFANDKLVEYNVRADSADTLINLGKNEKNRENAREILIELGSSFGKVRSIYDNAQNVHTEKIEKSCKSILNFLNTIETCQTKNGDEIDSSFVGDEILKLLNQNKSENKMIICDTCNPSLSSITNEKLFCCNDCREIYKRKQKISLSLNRISLDRGLYNNLSLETILTKLWSFINSNTNDNKEEMTKRLVEELEEMSGTCSSGFVTRLLNTLSGFDENVRLEISYEDQIIANFVGRLNFHMKNIKNKDSPFHSYKKKEVLELFYKINNKNKDLLVEDLLEEDLLVEDLLEDEDVIIDDFYENVLEEMTEKSYDTKPSFLLFFRTYLSIIREELYTEFKTFVNDFEFDIYFRKALSTYDGIGKDFV